MKNTSSLKPTKIAYLNKGHPLSTGLVGAWLFNEMGGSKIRDLTERNHGVYNSLSSAPTRDSYGVGIDNNTWPIKIPYSNSLNIPTVTIAIEIKTTTTQVGDLVQKEDASFSANAYPYTMSINDGGANKASMRSYDGTNAPQAVSTAIINDGNAHQIVGTRKKGVTLSIYVDGIFNTSVVDTAASGTNNLDLALGGRTGGSSSAYSFVGKMRYCYIWNRVLTDGEIRNLYKDPFQFVGIKKPLIGKPKAGGVVAPAKGIMTPRGWWGDL